MWLRVTSGHGRPNRKKSAAKPLDDFSDKARDDIGKRRSQLQSLMDATPKLFRIKAFVFHRVTSVIGHAQSIIQKHEGLRNLETKKEGGKMYTGKTALSKLCTGKAKECKLDLEGLLKDGASDELVLFNFGGSARGEARESVKPQASLCAKGCDVCGCSDLRGQGNDGGSE